MIGTRTPFRFSFVGGGTDIASFYRERPGKVVCATINKYMYIYLHPHFENKFLVKYSTTEFVDKAEEIRHPIVRCALQRFNFEGLDINSIADIPAGTGLGSSSAFAVGLLHALYAQAGKLVSKEVLASQASHIEIEELKAPIGKQDQYAAAYGGINRITFLSGGAVSVDPIPLMPSGIEDFRSHLIAFYLGDKRDANAVLSDQLKNISAPGHARSVLADMADLADPFMESLSRLDFEGCGVLLEQGWNLKRKLSNLISSDRIDKYHDIAMRNGAIGGKLLGAGGGGFLLFIAPPDTHTSLREKLRDLKHVEFDFDFSGSQLIHVGP